MNAILENRESHRHLQLDDDREEFVIPGSLRFGCLLWEMTEWCAMLRHNGVADPFVIVMEGSNGS